VKPCEPRQVRKEAAAAGALRVADSSGPGGRFIWDKKGTVSLFPGSGFAREESKLSPFLPIIVQPSIHPYSDAYE